MIAGQPVPEDNTNSLEQFKIIDQYEKEIFLSCCELLPLFSQNDFHLLRNLNYTSKKFRKYVSTIYACNDFYSFPMTYNEYKSMIYLIPAF